MLDESKAINCITMVNPNEESLDSLIRMRFDYMRKGYLTDFKGENIGKLRIIKLLIYEKGDPKWQEK